MNAMNQTMKLLDVVALLEDCPEQGLVRGKWGRLQPFSTISVKRSMLNVQLKYLNQGFVQLLHLLNSQFTQTPHY
jgi:hypothetical protein